MQPVDLIGVRFDGSGRERGQADAPVALRSAGLASSIPDARLTHDVTVSRPDPQRGHTGFVNESALLEMIEAVHSGALTALAAGRFPLFYGADCAVLLGTVPALRDVKGRAGLLFIDGHEDATTMEQSSTGEAANMEIALLLGLTGTRAPRHLRQRLPALQAGDLVMLGQRDEAYRQEIGVATIADRIRLHSADEVRRDPVPIARDAARHLQNTVAAWWLHIDLDVLDGKEFSACGAASDPAMPQGLTWSDLTTVTRTALQTGGCSGWSVGVYNADLDPGGHEARRVVQFITDVLTDR